MILEDLLFVVKLSFHSIYIQYGLGYMQYGLGYMQYGLGYIQYRLGYMQYGLGYTNPTRDLKYMISSCIGISVAWLAR